MIKVSSLLILYESLLECNLKLYIPVFWNTKKKRRQAFNFFLYELKLGLNASQTAVNVKRTWSEGSACDRRVRRWFMKSTNSRTSLEDPC